MSLNYVGVCLFGILLIGMIITSFQFYRHRFTLTKEQRHAEDERLKTITPRSSNADLTMGADLTCLSFAGSSYNLLSALTNHGHGRL